MAILNLGILAHVDAGKTSLTERILFEAGVIRAIGSVDKGTTQTDTLELERARGITIKSAVVSFQLNDLAVNLIDTPGHADFIAEVERSLSVLDAVVLVISAVEGVQPQTRRLAQVLRSAGIPLIVFINKIDRLGAREEAVLADIHQKLQFRVVPLNRAIGSGDRTARVTSCDWNDPAWRASLIDLLAECNESIIEEYERADGDLSATFLENELRAQVACAGIVPIFCGSAITGAGVPDLLVGIEEWLPPAPADHEAPLAGTVFKIARRPSGEKMVYVRLFAGEVAVRQRVHLHRRTALGEIEEFDDRVTAIDHFASGSASSVVSAIAGEIVVLHGLRTARIGDRLGSGWLSGQEHSHAFPAPALESVVRPLDPDQITHLRTALEQLAEQDPLISLRQRNEQGEISVRLYGEVQKEVLMETLARDYGITVSFGPTMTVCIERPIGIGEHTEFMGGSNPFYATIGFHIEPADVGSGIRYQRELGRLPLAFYRAIEETIYEALTQGLFGWEVTDCTITLTEAGFSSSASTAADFRRLTPLVLLSALQKAGTVVCEPIEELDVEIPEDTFGAVCGALVNTRASIRNAHQQGGAYRIVCDIPTIEIRAVEQNLPGLTRGEGGWLSSFAGYVPVTGEPLTRARTGPNPLNRAQYLVEIAR